MKQYMKFHVWDFFLTVLIAIGMHLNTFSAFMVRESYMTNYPLIAAVTFLMTAIMFVVGYNRRNALIGAGGIATALIIWIIYLRANDLLTLEDGADETIPAFWTIVLFGTALIYVLTRSRKVLFFAAPIGLLFCGAFRFLEYPVSVPGLFLLVAAVILELLYLVYKDSLLTASYGNYNIGHFLIQSLAVLTAVIMLATGAFYGIVKPLDPPTRDLKLITKLMSFDIMELLGVASTQELREPDDEDQDDDDDQKEEEEEEEKEDEDKEDEQNRESEEDISASTITYDERDYTVYWVTALILFLLVLPFAIKYALRARRRRRIQGLDANNQAAFVYDFFLKRFKRLGFGKPDSATILEYAEQQEDFLLNFRGKGGTTFEELSDIYNRHLYSGTDVTPAEASQFMDVYNSFYKNAKEFLGNLKYSRKFWIL